MTALAFQSPGARLRAAFSAGVGGGDCARPCTLRLPRGALTLCFDDFSQGAALTGAAALERVEARGTFFVSAGRMGAVDPEIGALYTDEDVRRLAGAGHEIGCAACDHRDERALEADEALSQCARNTIELALIGLSRTPRTFAYPQGRVSRSVKHALPGDFVAARGRSPGLNRGRVDMAQLKALPFFGWAALDPLLAALDRADRDRAWMIVYMRDVANAPSAHGAPTGALGALLRKARALKLDILPLAEVADRALAHDALTARNTRGAHF
ncbi:MAG: polysaccharide deacetylase family protein [Alphaproteobacteria bacterium]|nr:polysaccharide deacetylase family protein [Alphaproteobacteria bacterium]